MIGVVPVNRTITKSQECCEKCVHHISRDQVDQYAPTITVRACRPRLNDTPPKETRGAEKAEMLDRMPALMLQGEVEGRWNMPCDKGHIHGSPCNHGRYQPSSEAPQKRHTKERTHYRAAKRFRQAAQQRNDREAQQKKR